MTKESETTKKQNSSKVFLAFLIGGAIGATTVLLYAPASGEETREKIKNKITKTKQQMLEQAQSLVEHCKTMLDKKKDRVKAVVGAGKEALSGR